MDHDAHRNLPVVFSISVLSWFPVACGFRGSRAANHSIYAPLPLLGKRNMVVNDFKESDDYKANAAAWPRHMRIHDDPMTPDPNQPDGKNDWDSVLATVALAHEVLKDTSVRRWKALDATLSPSSIQYEHIKLLPIICDQYYILYYYDDYYYYYYHDYYYSATSSTYNTIATTASSTRTTSATTTITTTSSSTTTTTTSSTTTTTILLVLE